MLIMWSTAVEHGFPAQSWLTFRQALSLGGNVRRGELGTTVVCADLFIQVRRRNTGDEPNKAWSRRELCWNLLRRLRAA